MIHSSIFFYSVINLAAAFCPNFYMFSIVYGIGSGCCLGLGYLLTLYIAWTYLPTRKALVTGLCLMATGLCPTLLPTFTDFAANPDGLTPDDPHYGDGFKDLFIAQAILYFIIFVVNIFLLPGPKKSETMKQQEIQETSGSQSQLDYGRESYGRLESEEHNVDDFLNEKATQEQDLTRPLSTKGAQGSPVRQRSYKPSEQLKNF